MDVGHPNMYCKLKSVCFYFKVISCLLLVRKFATLMFFVSSGIFKYSSQVLQEMQQFSKAEEHFDIAINLEPKNPVHRVYKGSVSLFSAIYISS